MLTVCEPKYKVSSHNNGVIVYEMTDIETLMRIADIPQNEKFAIYTCEIGQKFRFKFKLLSTEYKYFLEVERVI